MDEFFLYFLVMDKNQVKKCFLPSEYLNPWVGTEARLSLVVSETLFKSVAFDEALFHDCKHLLNDGHYI